jgi:hypothetical protein
MRARGAVEIDRCAVEAEAASPRTDDLYPRLLDQVVRELALDGAGPAAALAAAGRAVRSTPWAGYRTGRARLASAAASYLTWLAPPAPWTAIDVPEIAGRRPVGWSSPGGEVLIDLLSGGTRDIKRLMRAAGAAGIDFVAVRALDLLAPTRSTAYPKGGLPLPLPESPWWFAGGAR